MITLYDQCFTCRPDTQELWAKFTEIAIKNKVEIRYIRRATADDYQVAMTAKKCGIVMPFWKDEETGEIDYSLVGLIAKIHPIPVKKSAKKTIKRKEVADDNGKVL